MNFIPLIIESVALACGVICFKYITPRLLRIFVLLMLLTCINECAVVPFLRTYDPWSVNIVYNVFSFIDMAAWLYLFFRLYTSRNMRMMIITGAVVCFVYSLFEILFQHSWYVMHFDSFRLYGIFIILLCMRYFILLTKKTYHDLLTDPVFWLCAGAVCFHSIFFVNLTTVAENNYWQLKDSMGVFLLFNNIANILYYSCICMCFIACYIKYKYSPNRI
jgi:hypothetical protein